MRYEAANFRGEFFRDSIFGMEGSWVPRSPKAVNRFLDVNRLISLIKKEDSHFRDLEKFGIKAVVAMFIKGSRRCPIEDV